MSIHDDDARRGASRPGRAPGARARDAEALPPELAAAVQALRRLPTPAPGATARIAAAATGGPRLEAGRRGPHAAAWRAWLWSQPARRGLAAAAVLAVAVGAGALLRPRIDAPAELAARPPAAPAAEPGAPASSVAARDVVPTSGPASAPALAPVALADEAPRPVAFVLHRPGARSVALAGDFNGWSADATPLAAEGSGTWSVTLPLTPGRHTYNFVVDGSTWVLDPRAPVERDPDYGRDHSVVVVGVR